MEVITRAEAMERGLDRYYTGKPCKRGHLSERRVSCRGCRECHKELCNTPEQKARHKKYKQTPEYKAKWKEYVKTPAYKAWRKEYANQQYTTNENFKISAIIRDAHRRLLNGKRKPARTIETLGCTIEELRQKLESQFRDGMTWDNFGTYWHIDHIIPLSSFTDLSDPEQFALAQHYTNLQPLLWHENLDKSDRLDWDLEEYRAQYPERYETELALEECLC